MSRFPSRKDRREKRKEAATKANERLAEKGNHLVEVSVQGDNLVVRPKPVIED